MILLANPTWSGGTHDVYNNEVDGYLTISGGTNTVHGDEGSGFGSASLTVQTGHSGLTLQGAE